MNPCSDRYFTAECTGNKKWSVFETQCDQLLYVNEVFFFPSRLFETCKKNLVLP